MMGLSMRLWTAAIAFLLLASRPSSLVGAWALFGQSSPTESCNCGDVVYGQRIPRSFFEVEGNS